MILSNEKKLSLGKKLVIWFGSYLLIAVFCFFYMNVPMVPLILTGVLTLIVTIVQHTRKRSS